MTSPGDETAIEVDLFLWNHIKKYYVQGINVYVPNIAAPASVLIEDMQASPVTDHLSCAAAAS